MSQAPRSANRRPPTAATDDVAARAQADIDARWWRMPIWWMVIGGPLIVVVAAVTTAVIAVRGADIVVPHDTSADADRSSLPAPLARNRTNTPLPASATSAASAPQN